MRYGYIGDLNRQSKRDGRLWGFHLQPYLGQPSTPIVCIYVSGLSGQS